MLGAPARLGAASDGPFDSLHLGLEPDETGAELGCRRLCQSCELLADGVALLGGRTDRQPIYQRCDLTVTGAVGHRRAGRLRRGRLSRPASACLLGCGVATYPIAGAARGHGGDPAANVLLALASFDFGEFRLGPCQRPRSFDVPRFDLGCAGRPGA
ncbi:MAG: hypothetical protein OXG35_05970, partial [Acidobacteria bacterium]|nr:hypothetical protein [Acidobacteriota bacterium]